MKTRLSLLACSMLACSIVSAENWTKVNVYAPTPWQLQKLENSGLTTMACVDQLGWNEVAVGPKDWKALNRLKLRYQLSGLLEDPTKPYQSAGDALDYRNEYFNADEILAFFEDLRATDPDYVTRQQIGTTINGETMWAYRIASPMNSRDAKEFVMMGLIHAREWVTGSCIMHVAKQALSAAKPSGSRLMGNKAIWIIPMANPDGYRYTWTNNRFWRKNRRNNGGGDYGVDLNRNYAKGWGGTGSSGNPGSQTYRGTAPFSEPETAAVRDFVAGLTNFSGFLDVHSYGQLILSPWAYTTASPPNEAYYISSGQDMEVAMSAFGETYVSGQSSIILYISSGATKDYFLDQYGVISWSFEMRDEGQFGFDLPESQIYEAQDEAWAGVSVLLGDM